jgi:exonuclease VII large subunit
MTLDVVADIKTTDPVDAAEALVRSSDAAATVNKAAALSDGLGCHSGKATMRAKAGMGSL